MIRSIWLVGLLLFLVMGCKTIENSITDYNTCMNDPVCHEQVDQYANFAHISTETAASGVNFPSFAEGAAVVVSNIVAFIIGVIKGRKKRG